MIKLKNIVVSLLLLANNQILTTELNEQDSREKYLEILKKRNPENIYLGSGLILENQNKYLKQVLDLLNLFILQDQDWQKFSKNQLQGLYFLKYENNHLASLADLFLRIWYFRKFTDEVYENLYEEDRNALFCIQENEHNALILFTSKFRYRMNLKTGEYSLYSNGEILNYGIMDKDLIKEVNKTLLHNKRAWQTQQQVAFAALVITLFIYIVLSN